MIRTINRWLILALTVILISGIILIGYTAQRADTLQREVLLTKTRLIQSGLSSGSLQQLNGSGSDLILPGYLAVKEELTRVRQADPYTRFTYVLGQRPDKTIFFFVDSEPPWSADYSAPGDPYPEASATLVDTFRSGDETTEGPVTDRWGTWVSGFVPVTDTKAGTVTAVIGTDVDARDWNMQIIIACGPAIIGTLLLILLVLIFFYVLDRNEREMQAREEAEAVVRESEERFRMLFLENPSPIFIFEIPSGSVVCANKKFVSFMGLPEDEIIGKKYADLGILQDPADQDRLTSLVMKNTLVNDLEFHILNKDGTRGIFLISGRLVSLKKKPHCFTIMQDVSELKAVEEEMHYYSTELRKYSTMLALTNDKLNLLNDITRHDILNQLTAISGYLDLMKGKFSDPALQEILDKMIPAANTIHKQISFTRDYQDVGSQSPQWYNLRKVITSAAAELPLSSVSVVVAFDDLELYADPLLEKVFYTLLENALRHGGTVTSVEFSCEAAGNALKVICQDNGGGVPKEYKEAIFQRAHFHHTGFGLYLSRTILGITGMEIREIGIPGKGARFEITSPADSFRFTGAG
jgi:PAS domain S-box-containing protein